MAMTVAERQQKHRAKSEGSTLVTARTASEKVKRFLLKYPEEVRAVDRVHDESGSDPWRVRET